MAAPKKHIAKAHDHFFRMVMSDKRVAREFFETHLSEDLRTIIDLNHLEIESGSYIDDMRQESIADMLFKTLVDGHDAYLYLIVDHQSRPDPLMPFRILKYVCNVIDQHLKDTDSKRIPLVLPLVVYHRSTKWNYSTNINDLIDAPRHLIDTYFLKPFTLIDLTKIEDAVLKQKTWAGVMELTLKHIFARDMLLYLNDIMELLKTLEKANGENIVETVLTYILDRGEMSNKDTFINMIKQSLAPEIGEKIVTIAEQFKAEGMQQGIEKEKYIIAERLLSEGAETRFVAKITQLPLETIQQLKQKSNH